MTLPTIRRSDLLGFTPTTTTATTTTTKVLDSTIRKSTRRRASRTPSSTTRSSSSSSLLSSSSLSSVSEASLSRRQASPSFRVSFSLLSLVILLFLLEFRVADATEFRFTSELSWSGVRPVIKPIENYGVFELQLNSPKDDGKEWEIKWRLEHNVFNRTLIALYNDPHSAVARHLVLVLSNRPDGSGKMDSSFDPAFEHEMYFEKGTVHSKNGQKLLDLLMNSRLCSQVSSVFRLAGAIRGEIDVDRETKDEYCQEKTSAGACETKLKGEKKSVCRWDQDKSSCSWRE